MPGIFMVKIPLRLTFVGPRGVGVVYNVVHDVPEFVDPKILNVLELYVK
jgi:hypothetical protein